MNVANAMVEAANDFLSSLDRTQRDRTTWSFSDVERKLWFYTPTDHGGLPLSEMDAKQHRLAWRLLAAGLSEAGYNTAAVIVGQENILDRAEDFGVDFGRDRGRDPLLYWIAIFGQPAPTGAWGWRFGGHHVSLNFTIVDGHVVAATPSFFGADPASVPLLGPHLHRPLAAVEDLGRELVRSLGDSQVATAVLSSAPPADLVGVNRTSLSEGDQSLSLALLWRGRFEGALDELLGTMQDRLDAALGGSADELARLAFSGRPKGLTVAAMTGEQAEILRQLLSTYVGRIHDDLADEQMAKLDATGLGELHFLWAGSTEVGDPHYYRIQGRDLLVEYDNAQRGGNHVHTVWRDLTNDFGGDPLAEHYATGSHQH